MIGYDDAQIWLIVAVLAAGTYLIRLSFLGFIRAESLPPFAHRMLRYTPVAVIPAMVAPLVLWPEATGGQIDAPRAAAALVTALVGWRLRSTLWAAAAGGTTLTLGLWLAG
jgi:branched-subunit amino acid transport protein